MIFLWLKLENVGYKRTKRGENPRPNDLFDIEYAPNTIDCSKIISDYNEKIKYLQDEQEDVETKVEALKAKDETTKSKKSIEKLETEIETLKTNIESLDNRKGNS